MQRRLFIALGLMACFSPAVAMATEMDWSQPPVYCVEDFVPRYFDYRSECPKWATDEDPAAKPSAMDAETWREWNLRPNQALALCQAHEQVTRAAQAGEAIPEVSWLLLMGAENAEQKAMLIYQAADEVRMPPQILMAALMQETQVADIGVGKDYGNYSCGIGQLNVNEWCLWASNLPDAKTRKAIDWPASPEATTFCSQDSEKLLPEDVAPFLKVALRKAARQGRASYQVLGEDMTGIPFRAVGSYLAHEDERAEDTALRYAIIRSFVEHCADYHYGIPAKAHTLASTYAQWVPDALKRTEIYPKGKSFSGYGKTCAQTPLTRAYPLNTGWLLADAIYNSGEEVLTGIKYLRHRAHDSNWGDFTPSVLANDLVAVSNAGPRFVDSAQQRDEVRAHIRNVVKYTVLPGHTVPVR